MYCSHVEWTRSFYLYKGSRKKSSLYETTIDNFLLNQSTLYLENIVSRIFLGSLEKSENPEISKSFNNTIVLYVQEVVTNFI